MARTTTVPANFRLTASAADPFGGLVAVGATSAVGGQFDFAAVRFKSDGSIDTSFGNGGIAVVDFAGFDDVPHDVTIDPSGSDRHRRHRAQDSAAASS